MRLTYLKIENFGKHELLEYDLDGCPVIGLIGINKAGKSTVLKALEYILTGQTGQPNSQVYIRYGQPSATVEGWFTKEGKSIKIKRTLSKTSKRELNIDGKIFTAAKDVDEQMTLLFDGMDKKLLSQLVFVSQGELTSCLFGDQSDKENVFSKLIGIGHLYKLAEGVEQQITEMESKIRKGLPELIASMADMISENAEEIAVTENALKFSQDYTSVLNLFTTIKKQDELRSGYHLENNKLLEQRSLLEDSTKSKCLDIFEKFQFNKKGLEEYKTNLDNEYYQLSGLLYQIQAYHKDKQALELLRQEYAELNANYEKLCKSCNPE
jgi:DNA repair exonuclease SbcCD ATPase subunit